LEEEKSPPGLFEFGLVHLHQENSTLHEGAAHCQKKRSKLPAALCINGAGIHGEEDPVVYFTLMDGRGKMPVGQDLFNLTGYITKICHVQNAPVCCMVTTCCRSDQEVGRTGYILSIWPGFRH
jgi:hypothetical protein